MMRPHKEMITFTMFSSSNTTNECYVIDVKEWRIKKATQEDHDKDALEMTLDTGNQNKGKEDKEPILEEPMKLSKE